MNEGPKGAKLVRGVWLPESEQHFVGMITRHSKVGDFKGRGTYQKHKLDLAMGFVPRDRRRVAVDVGGHVGLWAMWLVRLFDRVEAFEPVPFHRELFALNVPGRIDPDERIGAVAMHDCALGDREGRVTMHENPLGSGDAYVAGPVGAAGPVPTGWRRGPDVPMRTLDAFALSPVDFVKIDVEGHELPVIRGAEATLRRERPIIVIEQKGWNVSHVKDFNKSARDLLKSWGARELGEYAGDHVLGWPA